MQHLFMGLLTLALAVGLGLYLRHWLRSEEGRASLDRRLLKLPLAGGIVFEFEVSKFARTVGTLVGNGVSLLKAISIAIDTVDNRVIKESLQVLPPAVKAGKRMSVALEESGMFTPMVIQMVRVGEESGSLDQMMLELARVFDDHVQSGVKRGLTLLEPGDEVILFEPFYSYHRSALRLIGAVPVAVPLSGPDLSLDEAALKRAIGPKTRAMMASAMRESTRATSSGISREPRLMSEGAR